MLNRYRTMSESFSLSNRLLSEKTFPVVMFILLREVPAELFPLFNTNRVVELGGTKRPTVGFYGFTYSVKPSGLPTEGDSKVKKCTLPDNIRLPLIEKINNNPEVKARISRIVPVYEQRTGKKFPGFYTPPAKKRPRTTSPKTAS